MTVGLYGQYGGRYVPETLIPALDELTAAGSSAGRRQFRQELDALLRDYAGRPTPLTLAERFAPGKRLYLKREDLLHTGAHKLNNALGQALIAKRLGKPRIVAETGAGQHGVAVGDRLRALRARVRRLHGRGRHAPPEPERRPHAPARRGGASRSSSARRRFARRRARRSATG